MDRRINKFLVLLCLLIFMSMQSLFSAISDHFSFQMNPQNPLHTPYLADPFNTDFALNYIFLEDGQSRPGYLYKVQGEAESLTYQGYDIDQYYTKGTNLIQMRTGTVIPFLRFSYKGSQVLPSLSVEGVFRGGFRSIFFAYSGTDLLGFDGTYSYGVNARLGDFLSFSYGRKHHSAHVGDEIVLRVEERVAHSGSLFQNSLIDYVRQDPIYYAISLQVLPAIRLYGELRVGDTGNILKPKFTTDAAIADGYRGRELQVGTELSFPVFAMSDFTIAFDVIMHESGKFVPSGSGAEKNGEYESYTFTYMADAPWEIEYQLVAAQTLTSRKDGLKARLTATYHRGRFPLFAFHMSKGSYIGIGAAFSF